MLATAAFLFSGVTFAQDGGKKKESCTKSCSKKGGDCCKDKAKTTAKVKA